MPQRYASALLVALVPLSVCAGPPATDEEVWAVRCITLQSPDRFELARKYADALKKVSGLKDKLIQVHSDDDGTAIFYGQYRREYGSDGEPAGYKPDPKRDLELIRGQSVQLAGAARVIWPFYLAAMDVLPTFRSQHPEWNLARVEEGYWALHVGVFFNTNEFRNRRSAAEQYCALLREQGEPAYFHHGPSNSSVYIGPFPREAVQEMRSDGALSGKITSKLQIVDPKMLDAQRRFAHSLQNGHTVYDVVRDKNGQVKERFPVPTFAVVIPRAQQQDAKAAPARAAPTNQKPAGW